MNDNLMPKVRPRGPVCWMGSGAGLRGRGAYFDNSPRTSSLTQIGFASFIFHRARARASVLLDFQIRPPDCLRVNLNITRRRSSVSAAIRGARLLSSEWRRAPARLGRDSRLAWRQKVVLRRAARAHREPAPTMTTHRVALSRPHSSAQVHQVRARQVAPCRRRFREAGASPKAAEPRRRPTRRINMPPNQSRGATGSPSAAGPFGVVRRNHLSGRDGGSEWFA